MKPTRPQPVFALLTAWLILAPGCASAPPPPEPKPVYIEATPEPPPTPEPIVVGVPYPQPVTGQTVPDPALPTPEAVDEAKKSKKSAD